MRTRALLMAALVFLGGAVRGWAAPTVFTVSATVPDPPSEISVTVASVNSTTNVYTNEPAGYTNLSFDPLTFNTANNIYLPDHYFVINFGVSGGPGTPDLTFTYTEGANPNGGANGLGYKTTATFAKEVVNNNGSTTESIIGSKHRLIDLQSYNVPSSAIYGGYARAYIGIWTGGAGDPANGQPFSNSDAGGQYTGSLAVTAVVA